MLLNNEKPGAPPWLWLWTALYIHDLFYQVSPLIERFQNLVSMFETEFRIILSTSGYNWSDLLGTVNSLFNLLASLLVNVPILAIIIGILTIPLRKQWIERQYTLKWPDPQRPELA